MYGVCKICGCTDNNACHHPDHGSCFWIDDYHELCSHCYIDEIKNDPSTEHPVKKGFRELPALFSTPMVQAILENRKTMTRRTKGLEQMNLLPDSVYLSGERHTVNSKDIAFIFKPKIDVLDIGSIIVKPQYQVGDQIWVKEEHYANGYWCIEGVTKKLGNPKFKFHDATIEELGEKYQYHDSIPDTVENDRSKLHVFGWWKRNSLFMPKAAARIWLECTGVRCERLQDITEADAIAEGIESWESPIHIGKRSYQDYLQPGKKDIDCPFINPITSFMTLWNKINGEKSWNHNPWVFVYSFKKLESHE